MTDTRNVYDALPDRVQRFVDVYATTMKVGESALAAGYNSAGEGSKLLKSPLVCRAIAVALEEKTKLARINSAWVLRRVALLADFSIKAFIFIDEGGRLYYDFAAATDDDWYCIDEITVGAMRAQARPTVDGTVEKLYVDQVKIKTTPKLKALEMVGKHVDVNAWTEKADVDGAVVVTAVTRKVVHADRAPRLTPPPPETAATGVRDD